MQIDGKNSEVGDSSGAENMGSGEGGGYPPHSQTPPLGASMKVNNGANAPPPAPTIPPPPLDDDPPVYTNGSGRPVKDSPV